MNYKGKRYNNFVFKQVKTNRKLYRHIQDYIRTYESTYQSHLIDYSIFKEHFDDDGYCLKIKSTNITMRYEKLVNDGQFWNIKKLPNLDIVTTIIRNGEMFNSLIDNVSHQNYLLYFYGVIITVDEVNDKTITYCLYENILDQTLHNNFEDSEMLLSNVEHEQHEIYYDKVHSLLKFCKKNGIVCDSKDIIICKIYQCGLLIHFGVKLSPSSSVKIQRNNELYEKFLLEAIKNNNIEQFKQICNLIDPTKYIEDIIKYDMSDMLAYLCNDKKVKLTPEQIEMFTTYSATKCQKWYEYYLLTLASTEFK